MLSTQNRLRDMLIRHEGNRLKPYLDCCGKAWRECECPEKKKGLLTIGVGRNIEERGISNGESLLMLSHDIDAVTAEAIQTFHWFNSLGPARQDVILSMLFNMGLSRLRAFKRMLEAVRCGNFELAAIEMLESKWKTQVKGRAEELAHMMRSGLYVGQSR